MNLSDSRNPLARRDFLRSATVIGAGAGLTGLMAACSDSNPVEVDRVSNGLAGAGWLRVDSVDTSTGLFLSLDALEPPDSTSDYEYHGYVVTPEGDRFPLSVTMNRSYADSGELTWVRDDLYSLEADDDEQPAEVRLIERTIPGSNVVVVTGQVFDSVEMARVSFSTTTVRPSSNPAPRSRRMPLRRNPSA
jgi:hypothetical protein